VETTIRILDKGGKIVLSGVGKSGHIGKKIAATLASTGSPSVFMHPVEALHGDLGILQKNDILIALSYSGETDELLSIMPSAKRLGIPVVAITGFEDSQLAECSDIFIRMTVSKEACPFNLAPTTTAVSLLAVGDALAIVLLEERGFTKEDYGRLHPGGAIGRAVTMRVSDIMRKGNGIAKVIPGLSVKECLYSMTKARSGSAVVTDENDLLLGIFTDGDFRRHAEEMFFPVP
jgi:arabinose-5-phosphate isomerase